MCHVHFESLWAPSFPRAACFSTEFHLRAAQCTSPEHSIWRLVPWPIQARLELLFTLPPYLALTAWSVMVPLIPTSRISQEHYHRMPRGTARCLKLAQDLCVDAQNIPNAIKISTLLGVLLYGGIFTRSPPASHSAQWQPEFLKPFLRLTKMMERWAQKPENMLQVPEGN